jgi:hypothetical protein
MEIRKVPASAGAEWLLGAFGLLRKSPLGLGLLGLIYAGLSLVVVLTAQSVPALGGALQLVFILIGPLLIAGMIFAAHEVDEGRNASPGHLLAAIRTGKTWRVITTLAPQIALALLFFALLYVIVGQANIEKLMEFSVKLQTQAQAQGQIDPDVMAEMMRELPMSRLGLWFIAVASITFGAIFFMLTIIPDIMFNDVRLFAAMRRSYRACTQNFLALLVLLLLGFVVTMAYGVGLGILGGLAGLIGGDIAMLLLNGIGNGVFVVFIASTMYFAWKQMLGGDTSPAVASTGIAL